MKLNKMAYIAIGAVFALILSFSWISWADTTNEPKAAPVAGDQEASSANPQGSVSIHGEISFLDRKAGKLAVFDGKQKHEFQLQADSQVLINENKASVSELQLGDSVEVICNSRGEMRYLVVTRQAMDRQAAVQEAPSIQPTGERTASQQVTASQDDAAGQPAVAGAVTTAAKPAIPEEMKIDLHQGSFQVKVEWKQNQAEVEIKTPNGTLELKGDEAKRYIQDWYAGLNLSSSQTSQQIVIELAKSFSLDVEKPYFAEVEWKGKGKSGKWKVHPKDQGKQKGKAKKDDDHDDEDREDD